MTKASAVFFSYVNSYPDHVDLEWYDANGVQAGYSAGTRELFIPGTGFSLHGNEWAKDWLRNAVSAVNVGLTFRVDQGDSGRLWGLGYLRAARRLDDWLSRKRVRRILGHSAGGAIAQILHFAWRNEHRHSELVETVTFGTASPLLATSEDPQFLAAYGVTNYVNPLDIVPRLPLGFKRIGRTIELPEWGGSIPTRHSLETYCSKV